MSLWSSFSGMVEIQITTADPAALLEELRARDITLYCLHQNNDLTVRGKVCRKDLRTIRSIAQRRDERVELTGYLGIYWLMRRGITRPAILVSFLIVILSAFLLPGRVYFVEVNGNALIPSNLILEIAEGCGVGFGAKRSYVRSERVKNLLLAEIPQLQWAGINTQGCVAVISVREKSVTDIEVCDNTVRSIVAACDGIVEECTVIKGNKLCEVGEAVKAGQVLVSGYTDCGIVIQLSRADAEIFAQTKRQLDAIAVTSAIQRTEKTEERTKYSLIIGKKQIKFYKHSGISDALCVKMKKENYLTLPGGFKLPVALVVEREMVYKTETNDSGDCPWIANYLENYLRCQMISGRILSANADMTAGEGCIIYNGTYDCYEMIGIPKYEEIVK